MAKQVLLSFAALAALAAAQARADFVAADTEPNNTFAARQALAAGNGRVTGALGAGDVDQFQFSFTPGQQVAGAIIGTSNPNVFDTLLGRLSSTGTIINVNDDSGFSLYSLQVPFGVDASGQVNLAVSGFPDVNLTGAHAQAGNYILDVRAISAAAEGTANNNTFANRQVLAGGANTANGSLSPGDVDFYTFTGLEAGTIFGASVTSGPDAFLGFFNPAGGLVTSDDDGGFGLLSALANQTVSADGTVTLAVTGFPDSGFSGGHNQSGTYSFTVFALEGAAIPEPSSMVLLGVGVVAGALGYRLRRRRAVA